MFVGITWLLNAVYKYLIYIYIPNTSQHEEMVVCSHWLVGSPFLHVLVPSHPASFLVPRLFTQGCSSAPAKVEDCWQWAGFWNRLVTSEMLKGSSSCPEFPEYGIGFDSSPMFTIPVGILEDFMLPQIHLICFVERGWANTIRIASSKELRNFKH